MKIMVDVDDLKPLVARAIEVPRFPEEKTIGDRLQAEILRAEQTDARDRRRT